MKATVGVFVLLFTVSSGSKYDLVDQYLRQYLLNHYTPCLTVGIGVAGSNWIRAYGDGADLENGVKCRKETMMRVASVSKSIGSALIASMVSAGQLDWDADIATYLPVRLFPRKTFQGKEVSITLRQLLSHSSGIRTTSTDDLLHDWEFRIHNVTQILSWFAKDSLLFPPGEGLFYSNHAWNVIGAIVESISKRTYDQVLNEFMRSVPMPTGQMDTRLSRVTHRASHYTVSDLNGTTHQIGPAPITDDLRPVPHWPPGGVLANVDDLLAFGRKILDCIEGCDLFPNATLAEMWKFQENLVVRRNFSIEIDGHHYSNLTKRYGLGWEILDLPEGNPLNITSIVYHVGEIGAANAVVAIIPERNLHLAALANRGGIGDWLEVMPAQILHILSN